MEEQKNNQPLQGRRSWMSIEQRPSSIKSLERISSKNDDYNLRSNLFYAISIESNRNSDVYQRMIDIEQKRKKSQIRNSGGQIIQYFRNSSNKRQSSSIVNSFHVCTCTDTCQKTLCPCYSNTQQLCIKMMCCEQSPLKGGCVCKASKCLKMYCKCSQNQRPCGRECRCQGCQNTIQKYPHIQNQSIQQKNSQKFSTFKSPQNIPQTIKNNRSNLLHIKCSCNKSHCLKGYCSCFSNGLKCGVYCICDGCQNMDQNRKQREQYYDESQKQDFKLQRQRYGRHNQQIDDSLNPLVEDQIDRYLQQDNTNKQLPSKIQFQPVDFTRMFQRMKM